MNWDEVKKFAVEEVAKELELVQTIRERMPKILLVHNVGWCAQGDIERFCDGFQGESTWNHTLGLKENLFDRIHEFDEMNGLYTFTDQLVTCQDCLIKLEQSK